MIERLTGRCVLKQAGGMVLDVAGVGYGVEMTETALAQVEEDSPAVLTIWVHTHVREDAIRLFGFLTHGERLLFQLLLSLNGVGPKHAVGILSGIDARQLYEAVEAQDASGLPKVPGVGPDLWKKILLGLKPKLKKLEPLGLLAAAGTSPTVKPGAIPVPLFDETRKTLPKAMLADLRSALENFGYKEKELQTLLKTFERQPPARDLANLIRLALAELNGSMREARAAAEELF